MSEIQEQPIKQFDHQALNDFRHRVINKQPIDENEVRQAIRYLADLRQGVASSTSSAEPKAPRKSAAQAKADAAEMLKDFL